MIREIKQQNNDQSDKTSKYQSDITTKYPSEKNNQTIHIIIKKINKMIKRIKQINNQSD